MIRKYERNVGTRKEPRTETRWEFSVRYINEDGQRKQKHLKDFKTRKECKDAMDTFLASMAKNTKREGLNFEFLLNQYKETWVTHSPSSVRANTYWFNNFILPYFKNFLVTQIKMEDVIAFQNKLRTTPSKRTKKPITDSSIKDITSQLKSFLNYCAANDYISRAPFFKRYTAVTIEDKKDIVIWDIDDFSTFIQFYNDDLAKKALFTFLFSTGVRKEELLGLEKCDFDFENNSVEIRRTYQFIGGVEYLSNKMKTKTSRRTLELPKSLMLLIKEYLDANPYLGETDRIFPFKPRRVNKWMDFGIKKTNVPRTTPKGLRHSFVSNAINKGMSITDVQHYVGHSTPRTTLDVYGQVKLIKVIIHRHLHLESSYITILLIASHFSLPSSCLSFISSYLCLSFSLKSN